MSINHNVDMKRKWSDIAILVGIIVIPALIPLVLDKMFGVTPPLWIVGIWVGSMIHILDARFRGAQIWRIFSKTRRDKAVFAVCQFFWLIFISLIYVVNGVRSIFIVFSFLVCGIFLIPGAICLLFGSNQLKADLVKEFLASFEKKIIQL